MSLVIAAAAREGGPPPSSFSARVIDWQAIHGRHTLPWQQTRDPYRVWLSEIMLQQTQVATVLGYYERFLQAFPDVRALAAAPIDDVMALWSGLGYYSRARNLHRCAQTVVAVHGGVFPRSAVELTQLPGIGRSTAAAVAAFCFGERVAILDGNVKRVLTRVLGFEGDLGVAAQERRLWDQATELLPERDMPAYTQGLMDLGATVCTARQPACLLCPAQSMCVARREGGPERYPVKTRRLKRGQRESVWVWLQLRDRLWLLQRPQTGIWAGLWSLPEVPGHDEWAALSASWPGHLDRRLPSFTHVLTHLDWTLHPVCWRWPDEALAETDARLQAVLRALGGDAAGRWFTHQEALRAGLPAPLKKLLLSTTAPQEELKQV